MDARRYRQFKQALRHELTTAQCLEVERLTQRCRFEHIGHVVVEAMTQDVDRHRRCRRCGRDVALRHGMDTGDRHRTHRAMRCLTRKGALHVIFKLSEIAQSHGRRLNGFERLAEVIADIPFKDEIRADQLKEDFEEAA